MPIKPLIDAQYTATHLPTFFDTDRAVRACFEAAVSEKRQKDPRAMAALAQLACSATTTRAMPMIARPGHCCAPPPPRSNRPRVLEITRRRTHQRAVRSDAPTDSTDTDTLQRIASIMNAAEKQHASILAANTDKHVVLNDGGDAALRAKVLASIADLGQGLLERDTEVRLLLLAALCGEHLLLLGPPGTAKSELSRRLSRLTGGRYYERLLTRFSVPEELFGPLSMRGTCLP